jgi:hypothetical protein
MYFREVVLKSCNLPEKPSYNLTEACKIIGCSRKTLYRMHDKKELTISPNKRIYLEEFRAYFSGRRSNLK